MTATIEKLHGPAARIEGMVDALDGTKLFGWAWDRLHPQERMQVHIIINGAVAVDATADHLRPDLQSGGIGDGRHAFEVELAGLLPEGTEAIVVALSPSTGERQPLKTRLPEEPRAETLTLLRQMAGALDMLGRGQRRLGAVLAERAEIGDMAAMTKVLADMTTAQQDLKKQQDCFEVFLVRFDSLMQQMTERLDAPPARAGGLFTRLMGR